MTYRKRLFLRLGLILLIGLVAGLYNTFDVGADAFFARCNFLNDCETFETEFTAKNFKGGVLFEGVVPDADLANSGNPLRLIVTTGDVYTRCHNTKGFKSITGDVLVDMIVQPGNFSQYVELPEGDYNFTIVLAQDKCANCPQAWVIPLTVEHKACDVTGMYTYWLGGNFSCPLETDKAGGAGMNKIPARFLNPSYTEPICYSCIWGEHKWDGTWTVEQQTNCDVPVCSACP